MTTTTEPAARAQRRDDLLRARVRIDAQLAPYGLTALADAIDTGRRVEAHVLEALAVKARDLVQSGSTHAEVAHELGLDVDEVVHLIAPRRYA